ncbi:right-handed parallel beta-helix repeat-containing protein [candidate division KSB1 bacterium]|nr:right-handed parallel beta-helix repeat-containing protein [candidate division KSB1 bacterium]
MAVKMRLVLLLLFVFQLTLYSQNKTLTNLPENSWYSAPNTEMARVFPNVDPGGNTGANAIIGAWGGGTYDPIHHQMILWGGGHEDYYGNELYVFKLANLTWERVNDPSQPSLSVERNSDGTPTSRHTYGGLAYLTAANRFFARGGSRAGDGWEVLKTWTYSFEEKMWYDMSENQYLASGALGNSCVYDSVDNLVYFGCNDPNSGLYSYDYDENVWTRLNSDYFYLYPMTIDTKRRLLFVIGDGYLFTYDLANKNFDRVIWTTTGSTQILNSGSDHFGLAYDSKSDRIVAWNGGPVYILDPETKIWTTRTASGAPSPTLNGIFGRWQYIPGEDVFIAITDAEVNVHFYKLSAGGGSSETPKTYQVGANRTYKMPSQVSTLVAKGDTVEIDAGLYTGDVASWYANDLTIKGIGGKAHMKVNGQHAEGKGIWIIKGDKVVIENIEFSGASVPDENGAGIRAEGNGLTIRQCYFHDNENGILGPNEGELVIENCEFASNGYGDGQTHNMYIGLIDKFTIRSSYIHHARIGHNIKSRARENEILYNRIMDEDDGTSSYAIDLPNGGKAFIIGNVIQQGPNNDNSTLVSYGAEGLAYSENEFYAVNNTLVNDYEDGIFFLNAPSVQPFTLINNLCVGPGTMVSGDGETHSNLQTDSPIFVDRANYDYRITDISPAVDAGTEPGSSGGYLLTPMYQYMHPADVELRPHDDEIDVGAYEYNHLLAVELSTFNATYRDGAIDLMWTTESESLSLGFNILKSCDRENDYVKLNATLITAAGTSSEQHTYHFVDEEIEERQTYYYILQELDIEGRLSQYGPVSVTAEVSSSSPTQINLYQNYPNPFNCGTLIKFCLPSESFTRLDVYDVSGRLITSLVHQYEQAGEHTVQWHGTDSCGVAVSNGAYFYRLRVGDYAQTEKMLLLK